MSERQEILRGIIADLERMLDRGDKPIPLLEKAKEKLGIGDECKGEGYKDKNSPVYKDGRINMGIGKIGDPEITFARCFRFELLSELLQDLEAYVTKVVPNFSNGTLYVEVYEIVDDNDFAQKLHEWIYKLEAEKVEEVLTLTTYDGCGAPLYEMKFDKIKVVEHTMNAFDYAKSDVMKQQLLLTFENTTRKSLIKRGESNGTSDESKTD